MDAVPVRTSLRNAAALPTSSAELEELRRRAWIEMGIVVLRPDELLDDWLRQGVVNHAVNRFGKRMKR